ncbi:Flagellar hook-associated protein 2 [Moorella thermoacetica]|uniref:flagellar filament capping protein FliD n=1 Tax=Neomoorella thermoacetica TaxID=1525 RepID=UPI0030CA75DA
MASGIYFSGLASGLDTESIITQLMDLERIPLTRLQQRKNQYNVEKNAWHDIYTRLSSLQSKLGDLKLASTFTGMKATSSNTLALTATAASNAAAGSYQVSIIQLAQAHKVASTDSVTVDDNADLGLSGTFSITVNGQTRSVTVSSSDSLVAIRDLINAVPPEGQTSPGAGDIVTASVIDHRLVITSKTSGEVGRISFADPDSVLQGLKLVSDTSGTILSNALVQDARDAKFTVDGLTITRSTNTITDVIQGVTLNLLAVSNGPLSLDIGHDTQKAVDAIQAMVDQYNSVMEFISTKAGDKGDLQGDPTLARFKNDLWQLMTDRVAGLTGTYQTPWSIGISTGAVVGSGSLTFDRNGKITLDTTKLTSALETDPTAVMAIFTNSSETGLVDKLDSYLTSLVRSGDGIIPSREQSLQNIMDDIDDQIARMEDRLTMREEQLRRQFTAMEQALAALQSQGNWLAGQIAGLGAYQQK